MKEDPLWGPSEGRPKILEGNEYVLFTFRLFAGRCYDIALLNLLKSSTNFTTYPFAWYMEKRMCHTSKAIESRTETAHMGESENPKMDYIRGNRNSELRIILKNVITSGKPRESERELVIPILPKLFQSIEIKETFPTSFCNT